MVYSSLNHVAEKKVRKSEKDLLRAAVCVGFVLGLAVCGGAGAQASYELSSVRETQTVTPNMKISAAQMNLNEQIEFSKKELAQRLGIEPDSITLSGARKVNWRSGALGCPEAGMNYTQARVPGVLILLEVDSEAHGYHEKFGGKPFYCPRESAEQPVFAQKAETI